MTGVQTCALPIFSYRQVAWEMKLKMEQLEPELGRLMQATPPWIEDMLKR